MIEPLSKPPKRKKNQGQAKWLAFRKAYLKDKSDYRGYYQCAKCTNWFKEIELDHIIKRSVRPDLVFDESNIQLLCGGLYGCHRQKDVPI